MIGAGKASGIDTLRIAKFFADVPKGPLFFANFSNKSTVFICLMMIVK